MTRRFLLGLHLLLMKFSFTFTFTFTLVNSSHVGLRASHAPTQHFVVTCSCGYVFIMNGRTFGASCLTCP